MGVGAFDSRFGLETYPKDSRGGLTRSIQALVRPVNDRNKIFRNRRTAAIKKKSKYHSRVRRYTRIYG